MFVYYWAANESLTLFEIPLGLINVTKGSYKEWALGGLGFIFVRVAGSVTVTGPEVPGHERSEPQKSQPEPSLV